MTCLSWKAVLTVQAFTAVFDMLPHGHRGNISRNTFTKIECDLSSYRQQFHGKSVNTSTDKEADLCAVYIIKYSDKFWYKFYDAIHRNSNLQLGCYCCLHFSWQNRFSIYMVALEPDPLMIYMCKDGIIYMYNIVYATVWVLRISVVWTMMCLVYQGFFWQLKE